MYAACVVEFTLRLLFVTFDFLINPLYNSWHEPKNNHYELSTDSEAICIYQLLLDSKLL